MNIFKIFAVGFLLSSSAAHQTTYTMARTKTASNTKRRTPCSLKKTLVAVFVATVSIFSKTDALATSQSNKAYNDMDLTEKLAVLKADPRRIQLEADCYKETVQSELPYIGRHCPESIFCNSYVTNACTDRVDPKLYALYQNP